MHQDTLSLRRHPKFVPCPEYLVPCQRPAYELPAMSKQHTAQSLQQPGAQETDVQVIPHPSIKATVASAADGLFSAVTDLVLGHGFGRKRSRSASAATDAGSNGIVMTTGAADASAPISQPAITRHHTAPAPLNLTPATAAGPTIAAQPRHSNISVATGVGATPVAGAAAPATPVHIQDQHVAARTGQRSLPVIQTKRDRGEAASDVVTTPTTPEAKAAAGLLKAAAPIATVAARSSKGIAAGLYKVTAAPRSPIAIAGHVNSSKMQGTIGLPTSVTTVSELRPNDRIRVEIPCRYTKQDGTKSRSTWYHQFDATIESIDAETCTVSLTKVTVARDSIRVNDPLVQAHCESIASRQQC